MAQTTAANTVTLTEGTEYDWSDLPPQFRMLLDKKKAARLVKVSDDLMLWTYTFDDVRVVKGAFLESLKALPEDVTIAAIFNGVTLTILGIADD